MLAGTTSRSRCAAKVAAAQERKAVADLPDDDPRAITFEDKIMADYVIFYHGRIAADDFGEILSLAGNGRGFVPFQILNSLRELGGEVLGGQPGRARRQKKPTTEKSHWS